MSTLNFDAYWRDHGVQRGLQGISKNADKASHSMSGLNRSNKTAGGGFGFAAKGAAAVGTGLLAAAGAAVGYGLKIAAGNEQAKISFTTMLGSGTKAKKLLGDLEKFAAKTPFEFPELQQATTKLLAFGFAQEEIIPNMRRLGDLASGLGIPIGELADLYGKARVQGRLYMEDVNQLTGRGIPIIQEFAKQFGVSESEVRKLVESGKIGFPELEKGFKSLTGEGGKFQGLMEAQSKSLTGMLSTLKDTFGMGLAKAIEPALPFIKGAIGGITKALGDMFAWISTHQEDLVDGILDVGNVVLGLAKTFVTLEASALEALASIADGVAAVLAGFEALAPGDQFSETISGLRKVSDTARIGAKSMNENLVPAIDEAHKRWNKFGADQKTKASLRDANQVITNAVDKTNDALKKNGKTVDENTEKGKKNRATLKNLADAHKDYIGKLKNTDASTKDVKRATDSARESFIKQAIKMGASSKEAQRLADKYGLVDRRINGLNDKKITIKFGAGSYSIGGVKYSVNLTSPSSVGRSATGGMVRGAGTGTSDSIPMMLSNGEFVVNAKATTQHRELLEALNAPGKTPHAPATGMRAGGVVSFNNQGPGGAIYAASQGAKFRDAIATAMGKDIGARAAKSIAAFQAAQMGGGPAGSAIASGGWASIYRILRAAGARRFTTYAGHDQGASRSRDITPPSQVIADTARRLSSIWYVIYNRRIASTTYGRRWRPYTRSNPHTDHVHVTLRPGVPADRGGMLPSGGSASNMSGNLERVLSPAQTRDFHNLVKVISSSRGGSVGNTYIVNAPNYVGDKRDLVKALTDLDRQGRLAVVRR